MLSPKERKRNSWIGVPQDAVLRLQRGFVIAFLLLFCFAIYLQGLQTEYYAAAPGNPRAAAAAAARASIIDREGRVLANSVRLADGAYERRYPFGASSAPVTGYSTYRHGNSGTEAVWNTVLTSGDDAAQWFGPLTPRADQTQASLQLTIDAKLQQLAYQLLGSRRGAIVLLEPATGAILAMASTPAIDPSLIDDQWESVANRQDAPLLNRAANGLYPPGSSMKVLLALGALDQLQLKPDQTILSCKGFLQIGNYKLEDADPRGHGEISLSRALAESCNVTFGTIGMRLGGKGMEKLFRQTPWLGSDKIAMAIEKPLIPDFGRLPDGELAQVAIGQGTLAMTPLHMATLAAAVANDGVMMQPDRAEKFRAGQGERNLAAPAEWGRIASPAQAKAVGQMMALAVEAGTAGGAAVRGVTVAGKTGTAENAAGRTHAWFIGFAPLEKPAVAIAVLVENAGGGGAVAAPLAASLLQAALN